MYAAWTGFEVVLVAEDEDDDGLGEDVAVLAAPEAGVLEDDGAAAAALRSARLRCFSSRV